MLKAVQLASSNINTRLNFLTGRSTMQESRIVVIGNANVDLTSYIESFPDVGETILSTDFTIGMGGKGANQAVAARRAGSAVAFVGAVGRDTFGDYMRDGLTGESLNVSHLQTYDGASGVASIMVDPAGANHIAVFTGASGLLTSLEATNALGHLSSCRFFVSQLEISHDVVVACLVQAKKQQMTTIVNTAPYRPLGAEALANTDWIIANEGEATALLGDAGFDETVSDDPNDVAGKISDWSEKLGVNLIITLGSQGAVGYQRGDKAFHAPSPAVTAVDTVGAGDCFTGYFVSLLDQGFSWQQAINGAVHAASTSVQTLGAQSSYPSQDEAKQFADIAAKTVVA
jgi:ribokinase